MGLFVDFSQISFESEVLGTDDIRIADAVDESLDNPMFANEFAEVQRILRVYETIVARGSVCRQDIADVQDLADRYPVLKRLLARHPMGSFSKEPSSINYEVSNEGFAGTAWAAIVKTFREFVAYIVNGMTRMWVFLTTNRQRTQAVDDLHGRVVAMQQYMLTMDSLLAESPYLNTTEYRLVMTRAYDSEFHNLGRSWNNFRSIVLEDPTRVTDYLTQLGKVLQIKLPPYLTAVDTFLTELSSARTEADVAMAMAKMTVVDMTSSTLFMTANSLGWDAKASRDPKVTPFQAMANYIKNTFKSWSQDRSVQLLRPKYNEYLSQLVVDDWSSILNESIGWSQSRTAETMNRLKAFSGNNLQPGLEQVYVKHLVPFMVQVTSVISGFMTIEGSIGMLVQARDGTVRDIYQSMTTVAKVMDGYANKNKAKLTMGSQVIWNRQRKSVLEAFNKSRQ